MTLAVQDLRVSLGKREVLHALSFEARRGELIAVVGPNGAGKTTLLKAIACLVQFSGRLEWDGEPLRRMPPLRRAKTLAYLPQGHVAHWPIAARDVVTLGRAPFASSISRLGAADGQAIDAALEAVDAAYLADRPITELSGGERARVMVARALAVGAPILLTDEPVASLDPAHQLGVMELLSRQAREGRLVIAVSHDLVLAARYADRVLVLQDGELMGLGRPSETLTADLMRRVFKVEPLQLSAGGMSVEVPWAPLAPRA
jgi:iron complex transport system ATP-binding protein